MGKKVSIKVAIVAKGTVSKDNPITVSITECIKGKKRGWGSDADPFPGTVKLSIVERDTWGAGDDLVPDDPDEKGIVDDTVVEFEGRFEANASKKGANFVPDETKATEALAKTDKTSPDKVWLTFEGRTGDPFELFLPRDANEGDESMFVEVAAMVTGLPEGVKASSDEKVVAVSRVRTPHTILAVEPLSQSTMPSESLAMDVILAAFHGDATADEKKKLADRKWSRFMLLRSSDKFFQSVLVDSACSLIVLTMVARYLRVPDGAGGFESLYDKHVATATFDDTYAPRKLMFESEDATKVLHGAYKVPKSKKEKAEMEAKRAELVEVLASEGKTPHETFFGIAFETSQHAETSDEAKPFLEAASSSKDNYWPVMLLWWIRQRAKLVENYDIEWVKAFKQVVVDEGGTKKVVLERLADGDMIKASQGKGAAPEEGWFYNDKGHTLPAASKLQKAMDLDEQYQLVDADWETFVTTKIDEGLPVIGLFDDGIYSAAAGKAGTVGHWCLFVGYRTDERGKKSFILNDPARSGAPQYDTLREDDLQKLLEQRGLADKKTGKGSTRERQGWNLPIERRKLMSLHKMWVLKPKGWKPEHRQVLQYDGRSKWSKPS